MIKSARRVAAVTVVIGTVLASTIVGTPVNASPEGATGCRTDFGIKYVASPGPKVHATRVRHCWDPDSERYLHVIIEKFVGGTWFPVAEGYGWAVYHCHSLTRTWYRAVGEATPREGQFDCG